jgi:RecA-family ATPase
MADVSLEEVLRHIDPRGLDYQDWLSVGMAIQHERGSIIDWEQWSAQDTERFRPGECARKWAGFRGNGTPVTMGTLMELAKRSGWTPPKRQSTGRALDWDDVIGGGASADKSLQIIDPSWVEPAEIEAPTADQWDGVADLIKYLTALFSAEEYVGYVCEAFQPDGTTKWLPKKGTYHRTAGELISELSKYKDIGGALGDWHPDAGAWIRFNPLDGQGVRDDNVVACRYALIESDTVSIERQAAIYAELELPIAALVHSGGKSLHAIVRIEATSKEEYRERVNFLHKVCRKNGLEIDTQNKNVSRLSRMPGVTRNGKPQYLVGLSQGKESWAEWRDWIEELNDNLPDFEPLDSVWANLPPLAPPLIGSVLREGHKLLLSGPSKAGKSYLLLQLAIAIAEGWDWMGWRCTQGRVLYVNLELDRPSCLQRLKVLYEARGQAPGHLANIDIWNLRGKAVPMDVLAPKLIRRAATKHYKAIIIDPIYKVITGDENAADKMAFFCNQFDRVCSELGAAVIYCHHHSKGAQGQKSSRDRSSGSGVFARDPDAILDIIELNLEQGARDVIENRIVCPEVHRFLDACRPQWRESIGQDAAIVAKHLYAEAASLLTPNERAGLDHLVEQARARAASVSAWRVEATLREFATPPPRHMMFVYPVHVDDTDGILASAKADGEEAPWVAAQREKKAKSQSERQNQREAILSAFQSAATFDEGPVLVGDLAESMGMTAATLKRRIASKCREIVVDDDGVVRTREAHAQHTLDSAMASVRDLSGTVLLSALAAHIEVSESSLRRRLLKDGRYEVKGGAVVNKAEEA